MIATYSARRLSTVAGQVRRRGKSALAAAGDRRPRPRADRTLRAQLDAVRALINSQGCVPDYEAMLAYRFSAWIEKGHVVIDVGAHTGRHLRHFVDLVGPTGRVIGFEPLPGLFRDLRRKFDLPNVELHKFALSTTSGETTFVHVKGGEGLSGLKERAYGVSHVRPETITVKVRRLDRYTRELDRLDWVKIDTEGGEIDCLRGATATLARLRPIVSVEYGKPAYGAYGHTAMTLFELARAQDYVLLDLFLNVLDTPSRWMMACDSVYWDFLMVPQELLRDFLRKVGP